MLCLREAQTPDKYIFMVPLVFVGVDEWPRTSSNKIDRKQLPAPGARADAASIVAPRSAEESAARSAFAAALGLEAEASSVEASFFELGGNSLRAVVLARRLTEALGRQVSAADVMLTPTGAGLAGAREGGAARLPPLTRTVDAERLLASAHAVSWNQSQLLTVHLVDGATAAYNIPTAFWVHGPLSAGALRRSLAAVAERHAVLRTTYEVDGGGGHRHAVSKVCGRRNSHLPRMADAAGTGRSVALRVRRGGAETRARRPQHRPPARFLPGGPR